MPKRVKLDRANCIPKGKVFATITVAGSPRVTATPASNLRQMELENFHSAIVRYAETQANRQLRALLRTLLLIVGLLLIVNQLPIAGLLLTVDLLLVVGLLFIIGMRLFKPPIYVAFL